VTNAPRCRGPLSSLIAHWPTSPPARSLFPVAPPVDSLNIVRMIISPSSSHSARIDVVGNNIAVVSEPLFAEGADSVLRCNLSVHQFPHFRIRADLSVPSWVFGIVDATDSNLALASFSRDRFPAAAEQGTVNRTELIPTESQSFLLKWRCCIGCLAGTIEPSFERWLKEPDLLLLNARSEDAGVRRFGRRGFVLPAEKMRTRLMSADPITNQQVGLFDSQ
jgi:hypothetical protein